MRISEEYKTAGMITSKIWNSVISNNFFSSTKPLIIKGVFKKEQLKSLSLPSDYDVKNSEQNIALADGLNFERCNSNTKLGDLYRHKPRTRVYESIHINSSGWFSLVNAQLTRLSRRDVVCSLYSSNKSDQGLGIHWDQWDGLIFQVRGSKNWKFYNKEETECQEITINSGDILLLPEGILHEVDTPKYSEHIVYAFQKKSID